jgi:hypothetical protein
MQPLGFQTFDQHILELFKSKQISEETARTFSSKKNIMNRGIDNLKALAGESVYELNSLSLEPSEEEEAAAKAVQEAAQLAMQQASSQHPHQQPPPAAGGGRG